MICLGKISEFKDEFAWLSNFWPTNDWFFKGKTVEHWFQATKFKDQEGSENIHDKILDCSTPGKAKRMGKKHRMMRTDWEEVKMIVMEELLFLKFMQNSDLKEKLLQTGDAILEEGNNWHDTFWGICPPGSGNGKNMLGKLLMKVRKELRSESSHSNENS